MITTCLPDLAAELNALLPACPSGQVCREYHTLDPANPCIHLKHIPVGNLTITEPCGDTLTAAQYVIDWSSGTILAPCTTAHTVMVSYTYNLAETYIMQAVRELGYLIRQRNTVQTPVVACCGVVSLPCSIYRILSITETNCPTDPCAHCGGAGRCNACRRPGARRARCTNSNVFVSGGCSLYLRGNELVLRPAACEDAWLEICYEGGYPLNEDDCFVGLSPELADLALLKAQALAYRNPKLLLNLAGYTNNSSNSGNSNTSTDEVTTVVKEKNCNRETTTTTKHGTQGVPATGSTGISSGTSSALSSLSTINWIALATQAEAAYQAALRQRTESTVLPLRRNGYRTRVR